MYEPTEITYTMTSSNKTNDYPNGASVTIACDATALVHLKAFLVLMSACSFMDATIRDGVLELAEEMEGKQNVP